MTYDQLSFASILFCALAIAAGVRWPEALNRIKIRRSDPFLTAVFLIALPLVLLFHKPLFDSRSVMFSNDGPLGVQVSEHSALYPNEMAWNDLNWLGEPGPAQFLSRLFVVAAFLFLLALLCYRLILYFRQ